MVAGIVDGLALAELVCAVARGVPGEIAVVQHEVSLDGLAEVMRTW